MLYQKRPVEIEAIRFLGVDHKPDSFSERPKWLTDAMYKDYSVRFFGTPQELDIETMEGTMQCSKGDYIIRGVHGELYPCKPDIFKETYEAVNDD